MPSITYDGRSFQIDGRRIWIVGGSIQYSMGVRSSWADSIRRARQAGLNAIETTVVWSRHEPRPGHFDFAGDADLRHFIQLIGEAGMHCILRVGPYNGAGLDFGGLPAWLQTLPNIQYRTFNGVFLEACSRFITALLGQVRDLQATSPKGGPILLVQSESGWTCGHDELGEKYLGELHRYLREGGLTVPIINANNLWQSVEGEIDAWSAGEHLLSTCRQLVAVRPEHPRLLTEISGGSPRAWGRPAPDRDDGLALQRRLGEVLAGCGQFNICPFQAGVFLGFSAGRLPEGGETFACTLPHTGDVPVEEDGTPGPAFGPVRRIATFASRFARVLSNLDPTFLPTAADPGRDGIAIVPVTGSQGGVVYIFGSGKGSGPFGDHADLMLPNGTGLSVDLGGQRVAWCLVDVSLGGRATLDWCNLNALAAVGKVLVCFGPAGAPGHLSINGSPLEVPVPRGKGPLLLEHEGIMLVVCSEEQVDLVQVSDAGVFFPASGIAPDGSPIGVGDARRCTRVDADGNASSIATRHEGSRKPPPRDSLGGWAAAPATDHAIGTSARFASIESPADLTALGTAYGYGWYRAAFKSPTARRASIMAPQSGDRLHLFLNGRTAGIVGVGPGADRSASLPLARGANTLVILAENLGRASAGSHLGERKGLFGPVLETRPIRAAKPVVRAADPINLLAFRAPLWEVQKDETTIARRLAWTLPKGKKSSIIVDVRDLGARALLVVNSSPITFLDRGASTQVLIDAAQLGRGATHVELAFLHEHTHDADLARFAQGITFYAVVGDATAKGEWAFARWEVPAASAYHPPKKEPHRLPTWWRGTLRIGEAGRVRWIDLATMSKGQCYVNGRHLGRYFSTTATGKKVGPQTSLCIPAAWLHEGDNEVVLFDEHGANPSRCKVLGRA